MTLLLLIGCPTSDTAVTADEAMVECSKSGNVELVPLDIWGRDLAGTTRTATMSLAAAEDPDAGPDVLLAPMPDEATSFWVRWEAPDTLPLEVRLAWDPQAGLSLDDPTDAGRVAWSHGTRKIGDRSCPIWTVYAGIESAWFASSGPAPTRNTLTFYRDGEAWWSEIAGVVRGAKRRVDWATWWWESDFELERPADMASMSTDERWANAALGVFESIPDVRRRILINRFWAENSDYTTLINTDEELRGYAETAGDDLEILLQGNNTEVPMFGQYEGEAADWSFVDRVRANPRYAERDMVEPKHRANLADIELQIASWHMKPIVVDGDVAFVGGMNTEGTDWDGNEHRVYDARRMEFDATADERAAVESKTSLPDFVPRKDYGMKVEGPAARDVESVFADRWNTARDEGAQYAEASTHMELDAPAKEPVDGALTQVVATMPAPWSLQAIRDAHARAFAQATRYIYIEDQYFRSPLLNDVIVARMEAEPDLVLIAVTIDVTPEDGGAKYTYLSDATFRTLFPDRYVLLQLRSVDLVTASGVPSFVSQDIYTHSKLRLVDDRYLSVGSCNFNNRGYLYEGEMDVAVLDDALTTEVREGVFAELVGDEWAGLLSDDPRNNLDVLRMAAEENQSRANWWSANAATLSVADAESEWSGTAPSGFVYPLEVGADYEWDVGPYGPAAQSAPRL